jgi:hypothetical protein
MSAFKAPFGRRNASPQGPTVADKAPPPISIEALRGAPLDELLSKAEAGDALAMCALGSLHLSGRGDVVRDDGLAAKWLLKSEAGGNTLASRHIALLSEAGRGVPQDYDESVRRLRPLFKAGDVTAGVYLGRHYAKGAGVARNVVLAYAYFWIATLVGDEEGLEELGELAYLLLPEQINEGTAIAHEWQPGRELGEFTNTSAELAERSAENVLAVYGPLQQLARDLSPGDRSILKSGFAGPGNFLVTVPGSKLSYFYQQLVLLGWVAFRRSPPIEAAQPGARAFETTKAGCKGVLRVLGAIQA